MRSAWTFCVAAPRRVAGKRLQMRRQRSHDEGNDRLEIPATARVPAPSKVAARVSATDIVPSGVVAEAAA